jgi:hypothetical protein
VDSCGSGQRQTESAASDELSGSYEGIRGGCFQGLCIGSGDDADPLVCCFGTRGRRKVSRTAGPSPAVWQQQTHGSEGKRVHRCLQWALFAPQLLTSWSQTRNEALGLRACAVQLADRRRLDPILRVHE